jgi:hypothetical protein
MSDYERMSELAERFPTLRGKPGVRPWNQTVFGEWLKGPGPGSGSTHAGLFVLAVWNGHGPHEAWELGHFDVVKAFGAWDDEHRRAFLTWAAEPWCP